MKEINIASCRRGFSLPMVLIFSIIGLALISTLLMTYFNYHGRAASTLIRQEEYNTLQSAIESARTRIRTEKYPKISLSKDVTSANDLIVMHYEIPTKIAGKAGIVYVDVFDSNLDGNSNKFNVIRNNTKEIKKMPPLFYMPATGSPVTPPGNPSSEGGAPEVTVSEVRVYTIRARLNNSRSSRSIEMLTVMGGP